MSAPGFVPVIAGLFAEEPDGVRLLGTRCQSCGTHYFPRCATCRNPECDGKQVGDALLPQTGTLYSYTIQHYEPPLFRIDDWQPYAIGVADLGDGVQVMGMLDGVALDEIRIGMPLRVAARTLYHNAQGVAVATYAFVPDLDAAQ